MSLSNEQGGAAGAWGTIYSQGREHSLGSIEHARSTAWSPEDEENYLARVRERAGQMATQLLTEARREAENIKRTAREEGYAMGLESAKAELDEFRSGMGEAVSAVLGAIEGQCSQVFQQWRGDIIALARLCVEKVTSVELSENRKAMLDSLLSESVAVLEQRRQLIIRVNPEDEAMLSDIVGLAQERFPDVNVWRVKADASISPGGMVVESESSLAEGRVESRIAAVQSVLENLVLNDGTQPEFIPEAPVRAPAPEQPMAAQPAENLTQHPAQDPDPMISAEEALPDPGIPQSLPDTANVQVDAASLQSNPEIPGLPTSLEDLDLSSPNLSQDDINAALEAMLAGKDPADNS